MPSTASPRRFGPGCVVNSPLSIAALAGREVALWGWGREGRAAHRALRARLPAQALTLFCAESEAEDARATGDDLLAVRVRADADALSAFDVVIKSPGISAYLPDALAATERGARFIGGTALWFAEHADAHTFCVTGTKGKSTTTALLAHLLRAGGHRTALCGNIGLPLLELLDPVDPPQFWAIELSSYQTRDVAVSGVRPEIAVATNVFPEHLDWHGGEARYVEDKLALFTVAAPRIAILNGADPRLSALDLPCSDVRLFGVPHAWHLRGETVYRGDLAVFDTAHLPLPGLHNRGNLCAVLAAIEAAGLDAVALAPHAAGFRPLPHRLQTLGARAGVVYVNDSISTTPHASLAALSCFRDQPVALLVGGHDRGLDWRDFADAMRMDAPLAVIVMGQNGPRIHALLSPIAAEAGFRLGAAHDLEDAMAQAREALKGEGVILLSPGAPSFGAYRDYTERGRHFATLAGFDSASISAIPGLGIA
ncbi:MAG: UDP-N-acetylmuramoyl-L-alanine--D-glutamate ligase [Lysobacteraceae bacterium]|nr:MAG: UDP-N-acetylmuramoyl-L-alanine--D-glutamate ligase [Xanthomonadaceae bacterium]